MYYKTDLIKAVSETNDWTEADAERAVNTVLSEITKCLKKGYALQLTGFGTFDISSRKAMKVKGFNGKVHKIKAHKIPVFRAGKLFKKAVK